MSDGKKTYNGVVPQGMEGKVDAAIMAFARGIAVDADTYKAPSVPVKRKVEFVECTCRVGDVLFSDVVVEDE